MHSQPVHDSTSRRRRISYVVLGLVSLAWLGLRSGTRPSRLAYPCQRVAAAHALGFLAYIVTLVSSARAYQYVRKRLTLGHITLPIFGLTLIVLLQGETRVFSAPVRDRLVLPAWTSPNAVSDVFAVINVPVPAISLDGGTIPDGISPAEALHDDGMEALINLMATHGVSFYKTAQQPEGIVGQDDVVIIKVNNQWNCSTGADRQHSHTNNDAVKGLIYRIVQHPESFTGAVIIADNGQEVSTRFDCADHNNAQDTHQSYDDVADAFVSQSYSVCTYAWNEIRRDFVSEYILGNVESGYVLVQDGVPGVNQLSYPKFEMTCGSRTYRISMRYGLWNGASYDNTRLKMINFPIIKRHTTAGATIAVKNYIGFLTTASLETRFGDSAAMHDFFWGCQTGSGYGLLGRQLALIRRADLNIVDAIWVNPVSNTGGAGSAVRDNVLLANTDPFAVDYYGSVYVLLPHMSPGSDAAYNADARNHGGEFRRLLLTNENQARLKGMADIIDLDDSLTADEEQAQFNVFVADASAPPDVTLSLTAEPVSCTVQIGQRATYTLSPAINGGYVRPVTFTVSGIPSGTAFSLGPNPVIPPGTSQLVITTSASAMTGIYTITVVGTSGTLTDTAVLPLILTSVAPSFILSVSPRAQVAKPNETISYTVVVTGVNGFSQPVTLTVVGLPTSIGAFWNVNPVMPSNSSRLTLFIPGRPSFGDHLFQIVGMAERRTATETVRLIVNYPLKDYLPITMK